MVAPESCGRKNRREMLFRLGGLLVMASPLAHFRNFLTPSTVGTTNAKVVVFSYRYPPGFTQDDFERQASRWADSERIKRLWADKVATKEILSIHRSLGKNRVDYIFTFSSEEAFVAYLNEVLRSRMIKSDERRHLGLSFELV